MYGTAFNYAINFLSVCDMYVWSHKVISQVFLQYVQPCYYVASLLSTKLVMLDVAIHTKYVMVNRTRYACVIIVKTMSCVLAYRYCMACYVLTRNMCHCPDIAFLVWG